MCFVHEVAAARPEIQAANPAIGLVMAHHASPAEVGRDAVSLFSSPSPRGPLPSFSIRFFHAGRSRSVAGAAPAPRPVVMRCRPLQKYSV